MMWRCVIVCLLAGPVLGGCGNYAQKQEVESKIGKPNLVQFVSGEDFAFALYGKSKPSTLGKLDQEIWYYINRQMAVIFTRGSDEYAVRPLTVLELLNCQNIYNRLYRQDNPPRDPQLDDERPRMERVDPGNVKLPPDYTSPTDLPPTRDTNIPDLPGWQ